MLEEGEGRALDVNVKPVEDLGDDRVVFRVRCVKERMGAAVGI